MKPRPCACHALRSGCQLIPPGRARLAQWTPKIDSPLPESGDRHVPEHPHRLIYRMACLCRPALWSRTSKNMNLFCRLFGGETRSCYCRTALRQGGRGTKAGSDRQWSERQSAHSASWCNRDTQHNMATSCPHRWNVAASRRAGLAGLKKLSFNKGICTAIFLFESRWNARLTRASRW